MKIAIVGAGKLGTKVLNALSSGNHQITVFDKDEKLLDKLAQSFDIMTVFGNAKEISLLKDNGISDFDFLIACTDTDEKNIVIASFAKNIGCKNVIARVRDPEHMNQFDFIKEHFKIDLIVNPDLAITNEISKYLLEKYTLKNGIFSSQDISMIQFKANRYDKIIGNNMISVSKEFSGMLVFAISRNGKIIIPHGQTVVGPKDVLFLIGPNDSIKAIYDRVYEYGKYNKLEKVMIMGGGKTGYYLANKLNSAGVSVKIVEISADRCRYLATHLDNVMILQGDATDANLLEEENISEMDAFVATTGFDEENLLLSLVAKQKGIEDVISKVSRPSYKGLVESMGIDMALNPLDIVTSSIVRFIKKDSNIVNSFLIQGQAEVMEIEIKEGMKLVNKSLMNANLPSGMLITAIDRNGQVIIPRGDTKFMAHDKITVFYLLKDIEELEAIFATKKFSLKHE